MLWKQDTFPPLFSNSVLLLENESTSTTWRIVRNLRWNRWNIKLQQLVDMYFPIGWPKYFSSKDVHCGELKSLKYNRDRSLLAVVSDHSVCIWNNRVKMKLFLCSCDIKVHCSGIFCSPSILTFLLVTFLLYTRTNSKPNYLLYIYAYMKCTRMRNLLTGHWAGAGQHVQQWLVLSES